MYTSSYKRIGNVRNCFGGDMAYIVVHNVILWACEKRSYNQGDPYKDSEIKGLLYF